MAKRIKVKGKTAPSSTRKKLMKEGSTKFIGPRTAKSEMAEYREAVAEPGEFAFKRNRKKMRVPEKMRLARQYQDEYGPDPIESNYGRGSIGSERLKRLLQNLLAKYQGGGQEFDSQD